jgi:hypothetical protein
MPSNRFVADDGAVNIDRVALRWQPFAPMIPGRQVSRLNSESSKTAHTRRYNLFTICHAGAPFFLALLNSNALEHHRLAEFSLVLRN